MIPQQLPWARPYRKRCRARLSPEQSPAHWGRCELTRPHPGEDHALDFGMSVLRWADPRVWDSDNRVGQQPVQP